METHHFRNAFKGWKEGSEVKRAVCSCTRSQEAPCLTTTHYLDRCIRKVR